MSKHLFSTGRSNPMWKGGRTVTEHGYILIRRPEHPDADVRGYIYEHRLVAEIMLGRRLEPGEQVHHINGDRADNRTTNLEVYPSRAHHLYVHRKVGIDRRRPGEDNPSLYCKCGCGTMFKKFDKYGRPRRYKSGHNNRRLDVG